MGTLALALVKKVLIGKAVQYASEQIGQGPIAANYAPGTKGLLTSKTTVAALGAMLISVGTLMALDYGSPDWNAIGLNVGIVITQFGVIYGRYKAGGLF